MEYHDDEVAQEIVADIKDDLERFNENQDASGNSDSHMQVSDSDSSELREAAVINPLSLKPVFVSKVDREMLDPCLQLKERQEKEKEAT